MKFNKFGIFAFAVFLFGIGGCSFEETRIIPDKSITVEVPISVSINLGGGDTRTILTEADNTLKWQWDSEKEEQIIVTNQEGERVSILTLDEIVPNTDNKKATFKGVITVEEGALETATYNFYYAGDGEDVSDISGSHKIVLSNQSGKLEDLQKLDVLSVSKEISINNTLIEVTDLQMSHRLSAGKFNLTFPDDFEPSSLYLWGDGIKSSVSISLAGAMPMTDTSRATRAITFPGDDDDYVFGGSASATVIVLPSNTITIAKDDLGNILSNDIYLMLAPSLSEEDLVDMGFVAFDKDNNKCVGKFYKDKDAIAPFNLPSGKFLCLSNGNALPVQMKLEGDDDENQEEVQDDGTVGPTFEYDDKKWRFVSGNLYYNTKDKKWGIFKKQTDYLSQFGQKMNFNLGTTPEIIDLFAWGATGIGNAKDPTYLRTGYNGEYNYSGVNWPGDITLWGTPGNNLIIVDLWASYGDYTMPIYDFGYAYMQNGRDANDTREYRTPPLDAYAYICDQEKSFSQGCIVKGAGDNGEDVKGALIIPDISTLEEAKEKIESVGGSCGNLIQLTPNQNNAGFDFQITLPSYDKIKELNALFFPLAGTANYKGRITHTDDDGAYWTKTGPQGSSNNANAYAFYFRHGVTGFEFNWVIGTNGVSVSRDIRNSVRLIVEVED